MAQIGVGGDGPGYALAGILRSRQPAAASSAAGTNSCAGTAGQFPAKVANDLLLDSFRKKIGAWQTMHKESDDSYLAVFAAKIDAVADAASLSACIRAVAESADEMEEKLTGAKDEY